MYRRTFWWWTACNGDGLNSKDLRTSASRLRSDCSTLDVSEPENGHLSSATLSIKSQHWRSCHKMACSGYSVWLSSQFVTVLIHASHLKGVSCRGRQGNMTKVQSCCRWLIAQERMQHLSRWAICCRGERCCVFGFFFFRLHLFQKLSSVELQARLYLAMLFWNQNAFKKRGRERSVFLCDLHRTSLSCCLKLCVKTRNFEEENIEPATKCLSR